MIKTTTTKLCVSVRVEYLLSYEHELPHKFVLRPKDDERPIFSNLPRPMFIAIRVNTQPYTQLYHLKSRDAALGGKIFYKIESGADGRFMVENDTGIVRTLGESAFDADASYVVALSAEDHGAPGMKRATPIQTLTVFVGDAAPRFDMDRFTVDLHENTPTSEVIANITGMSYDGQQLRYTMSPLEGTPNDLFRLNPDNGELKALQQLDYEKDQQVYKFKAIATELVSSGTARTAESYVDVFLHDLNDNAPYFQLAYHVVRDFNEENTQNTEVTKVSAVDIDSGLNGELVYSIISETESEFFNIETSDNVATITLKKSLDYEIAHTHRMTVQATDKGVPPRSGTTEVIIHVDNRNDNAPVFLPANQDIELYEKSPAGTIATVAQAYDPDGDDVTYSFISGSLTSGPFEINATTGVIKVREDLSATTSEYTLQVVARDNGACCQGSNSGQQTTSTIKVTLFGLNTPPTFRSCQDQTILENRDADTFVVKLEAVDPDGGQNGQTSFNIRYTSSEEKLFSINEDGEVKSLKPFNHEASENKFGVTVEVSDSGSPPLSSVCFFFVQVTDENDEAPIFDATSYQTTIRSSTATNTRIIRTLATDSDSGLNGEVLYSLTTNPNNYFRIDESSGWISLNSPLPSGDSPDLALVVEARDRGSPVKTSRPVDVTIRIRNSGVFPPVWAENYDLGAPIKIPENIPQDTIIKEMNANPSGFMGELTFSKPNGLTPAISKSTQDFDFLQIDGVNGVNITTFENLEYTDVNKYIIKMRVANKVAGTVQMFTDAYLNVELEDVNDEIPVFLSLDESGRYPGFVAETAPTGTTVLRVRADDSDGTSPNNKVTYSIVEEDDWNAFQIDEDTGYITTKQTFGASQKDDFFITVEAEDGAQSARKNVVGPNKVTVPVHIKIVRLDSAQPIFNKTRSFTVPEDQAVGDKIGTLTASQSEKSERKVRYFILGGNTQNTFGVNMTSGDIFLLRELDYKTNPAYTLTYMAFNGISQKETVIEISVTDRNKNAPVFNPVLYTPNVMENTQVDTSLFMASATYPEDNNQPISFNTAGYYASDSNSVNRKFRIDPNTGAFNMLSPVDRDAKYGHSYYLVNLLATVSAQQSIENMGISVANVTVGDQNDNAPLFDSCCLHGYVQENSPSERSVLTVKTIDPDAEDNSRIIYSLVDGADTQAPDGRPLFKINPTTGLIATAIDTQNTELLDRESDDKEYNVVVVATDQGTPQLSATAVATITLTDANDNQPEFTASQYGTNMPEEIPIGGSVLDVDIMDKDIDINAEYDLTLSGPNNDYFYFDKLYDASVGVLKIQKRVDYETSPRSFDLTATVRDTLGRTDTARIVINVTAVNEGPVVTPSYIELDVEEDTKEGDTVTTFSAVDAEGNSFRYEIDRETDWPQHFAVESVDPATGAVKINKLLDYDMDGAGPHVVHVLAIDNGNPSSTGTATMVVTVVNVNDNGPIFDKEYNPIVQENSPTGTYVEKVGAVDPDDDTSDGFTFKCGTPCDDFSVASDGVITTKKEFDREAKPIYEVPIVITDQGGQSATSTLSVIIGDEDESPIEPGEKNVIAYSYQGNPTIPPDEELADTEIGMVHVEDPDMWQQNLEYTFATEKNKAYFTVDETTGLLYIKPLKIPPGEYNLVFNVEDTKHNVEVQSTVKVTVIGIFDDAVYSSGSFRFKGTTAKEFITAPSGGGKSNFVKLQELIAQKLNTKVEFVDIFSLRDDMFNGEKVLDVRYSAHGSPYYREAKLNGIMGENIEEIENLLNLEIGSLPIDNCIAEKCPSGGCTNKLVTSSKPVIIDSNGTALVGVDTRTEAVCECSLGMPSTNVQACGPLACLNNGTCTPVPGTTDAGYTCECPPGFDGPRCQQRKHSFQGDGWAWYKTLSQCEDSLTSLEFMTTQGTNSLLLYNGPINKVDLNDPDSAFPRDFIAITLQDGYPRLKIDHGSGALELTITGKDSNGAQVLNKLNDGKWHKLDVYRSGKDVRLVVDDCDSSVVPFEDRNWIADRTPCEAKGVTPGGSKYLNIKTPLQLGGRSRMSISPSYPAGLVTGGFVGCVQNLQHNGELYDLHIGSAGNHENSKDGCPREATGCSGKCKGSSTCVASLDGQHTCTCLPGYYGADCDEEFEASDFGANSYLEWTPRSSFISSANTMPRRTSAIQLMFRTRQPDGVLFSGSNGDNNPLYRKYIIIELKDEKLQFRHNLGNDDDVIRLTEVSANDGAWHTVKVERVGKLFTLKMDNGEGRFFNQSVGVDYSLRYFVLTGAPIYGGADVIDNTIYGDYKDGCMKDIRYNEKWFPQTDELESVSGVASVRSVNVNEGCSDGAVCSPPVLNCPADEVCLNIWRKAVCGCATGKAKADVDGVSVCIDIITCEPNPCENGGVCQPFSAASDIRNYRCVCPDNCLGYNCETCTEEVVAVSVTTGMIVAIVICLVALILILLLCVLFVSRRDKRHLLLNVEPESDVRENMGYYDEEGPGDEDMHAYDINTLRKPVDSEPPIGRPENTRPVHSGAPFDRDQPDRDQPDIGDFMDKRLGDADDDPNSPPFDSVREYEEEGSGSTAGSLSSLNTSSSGDQDFDYLNDLGPKFKKLADMYGAGQDE
ncbi:unnamed protein product [Owenia fusiformis]|uniref:Uncharacterized protein n=1 Tax=Owenia fusiformis TaxID=6347 RepID=A0A8J1TMY2_OWEFU|nr:unnamed protein product [Owenia fusiformis]